MPSVLITGSSKGLGKALALEFAKNNYNIILHGRDENKLILLKEEIEKKKVSCEIIKGDLNSTQTIQNLYQIAKEKDIDILINNAGVHCPGLSFEKLSENQISEILQTNLTSTITLTSKIYPLFLQKNSGSIININSVLGLEPKKLRTIYVASKHGLRGFSQSLRLESPENIKVLDVYPSRIKTLPQYQEFGMSPEEVAKKIFQAINSNLNELILDDRPKS
tara:strand:- start:4113 stop:4775 length:663 start_codon:yes stop_codon:yes gene_type:complete